MSTGTSYRPLGAAATAAVCLLALAPFVDKAFHIDDPLFVWIARHVQSHPLDPYGFPVNWYGFEMSMSEVTKNPPLTAYAIAVAAAVAGWSERALHVAFLVPALAAALGAHALAGRLTCRPTAAAIAMVLTPAFAVSSTTVMSDTMLLAFWVWAIVLWLRGLEVGSHRALAGSAVLAALAALTKYFGVGLVPLLVVYSLARRPRADLRLLAYLLVPVGAVAAFHLATAALYGRGLLADAASYATGFRAEQGLTLLSSGVTALSFLGGALLGLALFAPLVWSWTAIAAGVATAGLGALALSNAGATGAFRLADGGGVNWAVLVQVGVCALAGAHVLALAAADLWTRRDPDALMLALWVGATVLFAAFLNWSVNARAILPLAPAAAILLMRRLDRVATLAPPPAATTARALVAALLLGAAAIALAVSWADDRLADSARAAAGVVRSRALGAADGGPVSRPPTIWFQGHWGFQHYMQALGGRPMDRRHSPLAPGDVVVVPEGNTNKFPLPPGLSPWLVVQVEMPAAVTTMSTARGAGFYADVWGPLPFALGPVPPERYFLYRVVGPRAP